MLFHRADDDDELIEPPITSCLYQYGCFYNADAVWVNPFGLAKKLILFSKNGRMNDPVQLRQKFGRGKNESSQALSVDIAGLVEDL